MDAFRVIMFFVWLGIIMFAFGYAVTHGVPCL